MEFVTYMWDKWFREWDMVPCFLGGLPEPTIEKPSPKDFPLKIGDKVTLRVSGRDVPCIVGGYRISMKLRTETQYSLYYDLTWEASGHNRAMIKIDDERIVTDG